MGLSEPHDLGVGELRDDLVHLLPEGPLYFPLDQSTDLTTENRVAEVIREKALHLTRDEVPHAIMVVVEEIGDEIAAAPMRVNTFQPTNGGATWNGDTALTIMPSNPSP